MAPCERLRFGDFTLDTVGRRLKRGESDVALQPQVFATLAYLAGNADRTVTKDELLTTLWPDAVVGEAALTRCVSQLRRALGDETKNPHFVATVPRVGFRFVAPVEPVRAPDVAAGETRSLAVLPFRPLQSVRPDESLELGVAEALITRLSAIPGFVVRSLTTVRRYTDEARDPVEIGRELEAEFVLDGSVQRSDQRLRVAVRLLDVANGEALLSELLEEPFREVFALQDTLCRRIARAVSAQLGSGARVPPSARETDDPEAYAHYLRGRLRLGRLMPEDARRSLPHFERALVCDPRYARALAAIGEAWIVIANGTSDPAHAYAEARRAGEAALALDDQLGGGWSVLATIAFFHDWDWTRATRCFERALELSPNNIDTWCTWSNFHSLMGYLDEGIAIARHALELDPASPMAGAWLAQALHMAGRNAEAMEAAQATLARSPGYPMALLYMGLGCLFEDRPGEAVDWFEQATRARPDFCGLLAHAYLRDGREDAAAGIESLLNDLIESGEAAPFALAPVHIARNDTDRLFEALEHTFELRTWEALVFAAAPSLYAPYRSDPRAKELIRRLRLPAGESFH